MSRLRGENLKKVIFFELLPFENLDIESLISQKLPFSVLKVIALCKFAQQRSLYQPVDEFRGNHKDL